MTPDQVIGLALIAFALGLVVAWGFANFLDEVWSVARSEQEERER